MTDRSKFEQMLEYLISDEQDKAKELFHDLVVEKSREIYEEILSEDFSEEVDEAKEKDETDEDLDEAKDEDDEEVDENFSFEGDDEVGDDEVGGDATDDFMGDIEAGDEEGDEGEEGEGDIEDRVVDLEDALDDLKAEFERMMGGEEEGDDMGGDDMGDMGDDEMGMDMDEPVKDSFDISDNFMREYIEKVTNPKGGDNGVNTRSPLAGKNDMGGTTANIVKGGESKGDGTKGGLANPSAKEENFGNINVPGGNAGKTAFKKKEPGHGAEKKGTGDMGDKSAGSVLNGAPGRAK
jgi:hypothetical protein